MNKSNFTVNRNTVNNNSNSNSMENVFDTLVEYGSKWECIDARYFNDKELASIKSAEVKASEYGLSMCFLMVNDKKKYIPLDSDSKLNIGDTPNPGDIIMKKLKNVGDSTQPEGKVILRVDILDDEEEVAEDFDNPLGI